ncbi:MAG: DUF2254 domain-containing protein [Bacteroidales bacterium]|nr:DUF2254 domain-containing protein [Bacteroidales bacterium]
MRSDFQYIRELLAGSFWFIPLVMVIAAIVMAVGLTCLDTLMVNQPAGFFSFFLIGDADSARSILSITAGAMIGVAGTVFSITLVALTLASSQFGPRLLRNFMHDKLNQIVLGSYIATFIYCLLILRTINTNGLQAFVPEISVLFAIILAIANIFLLVVFIHHIFVSIQADQVISVAADNLKWGIIKLFPDELGEEYDEGTKIQPDELKDKFTYHDTVLNNQEGYLQAIDNESLLKIAVTNDVLLLIDSRPGFFLPENIELVQIYSNQQYEDEIKQQIRNSFILGNKRTPTQDAEFAMHQMVEIAARALSPGINDPYTAMTCIDKLTATMCYLTHVNFPSAFRYDEQQVLRVVVIKPLTFSGMMDAA